jgi:hypothetical protein
MLQESNYSRQITTEDFHGTPYQAQVLALRNGPYLDFPARVNIETMALCNAACDFCPYPGMEGRGEVMPDELIEKILGELEEIPNRPPFQIALFQVSEPFLDRRVFDISLDIQRRFPEASTFFSTNGIPLTEENLIRLTQLKRVDYLNISVNDYRPAHYERTMRLPFARIVERLALIQRMKMSGALQFPVSVSRVGDGTAADGEFLEWVRTNYPSLNGLVTVRGSWLGVIQGDFAAAPDVGCRQWFQLHVLANAKVAFCCFDAEGKYAIGDARTHHVIHEIYNHPARRTLRGEINSRRTVDLCKACSVLP